MLGDAYHARLMIVTISGLRIKFEMLGGLLSAALGEVAEWSKAVAGKPAAMQPLAASEVQILPPLRCPFIESEGPAVTLW